MSLGRALAHRLTDRLARPGLRGYSTRSLVLGAGAIALALVLVGGLLTAYLTYRADWNGIRRISVQEDISGAPRPPAVPGAMNVLLIGSDSRAGTRGFGAGITGQRSDTVMVVHIAPAARQVVVLSLPRDTVVPILGCAPEAGTPGQAAAPAGQVEQLNGTFAHGGPGCLWKTIEQTTRIHVDNFIEVTFAGFEHVIDDLGGVSICLPAAVNDPRSQLHLSAGRHHVYGREALAFWRERYIGEGSDLQRIRRDQYLMAAVLQGIASSGLLHDPLRLVRLIGDLARGHYITTDSRLTIGRLVSIAETLRSLPTRHVRFIEVPTEPYPGDPAAWVQWAEPGAARLFAAVAHDTRLPASRRNTPVLASLRGKAAGSAARPGRSPHRRTHASIGKVISSFGGVSGNAPICSDSTAFTGPDGS